MKNEIVRRHELAIVGAGPAGLTAGVFAVNRGIDAVIFEGDRSGGQLTSLYPHKPVYNYPGNAGIIAGTLADLMIKQAVDTGITPKEGYLVTKLQPIRAGFRISTSRFACTVSAVILACGMGLLVPRRLGVAGEDDLHGDKLIYSVDNLDGWLNRKVVVAGGGDSAADNALLLANQGAIVTIVHRRHTLNAQEKTVQSLHTAGVRMLLGWQVNHVTDVSDGLTLKIENSESSEVREVHCHHVLVNIGVKANIDFLNSLSLERKKNRIEVDTEMRTAADGVFACGDVVSYPGKARLIVTAVGEAATAVSSVERYLRSQ